MHANPKVKYFSISFFVDLFHHDSRGVLAWSTYVFLCYIRYGEDYSKNHNYKLLSDYGNIFHTFLHAQDDVEPYHTTSFFVVQYFDHG